MVVINLAGKIVVGADEASRGLIVGPMVIGVCAIDEEMSIKFRNFGIKDSKRYTTTTKLHAHADFIKKNALAWSVKVLSAKVLNNFNKSGMSMDEAEAYAFFRGLEDIIKKVPDINEYQVDNFQAKDKLRSLLQKNTKMKNIKLIILPKADAKYISVGAGSILARDQSLKELVKIRKKYGDFGSGSTSDKKTITWLENHYLQNRSWPTDIIRTYWKTITNIEKKFK